MKFVPWILVAILVATNLFTGRAYLGQRDSAVTHEVREQQATGVALDCSRGTENLEKQAAQRDREAEPKRRAAADRDREHQAKAQQIMSTPPAVPGDACASAQQRISSWWKDRAKP